MAAPAKANRLGANNVPAVRLRFTLACLVSLPREASRSTETGKTFAFRLCRTAKIAEPVSSREPRHGSPYQRGGKQDHRKHNDPGDDPGAKPIEKRLRAVPSRGDGCPRCNGTGEARLDDAVKVVSKACRN